MKVRIDGKINVNNKYGKQKKEGSRYDEMQTDEDGREERENN
jgi:hypothetical protein